MAACKKVYIPLLALLFLVALFFFSWGFAAGYKKLFPGTVIAKMYDEVHAWLTFHDAPEKTVVDKVVLASQERRNRYDFSGFAKRDREFTDNGYLLISRYSREFKQCVVELIKIESKELIYRWIPPIEEIAELIKQADNLNFMIKPENMSIYRPLLMDNGDLIFLPGAGPMLRMDRCGNILWSLSLQFHHSLEKDHQGNIVCPVMLEDEQSSNGLQYKNSGFAVVSGDGELLQKYSITEALLENGFRALIYGVHVFEPDMLHVNDVQPVLKDTNDAMRGEFLVSARHISSIALLDPESKKIKWLKTGPWLNQHDVDQLQDGRYSIFGNDVIRQRTAPPVFSEGGVSNIYIYDSQNNTISEPYSELMKEYEIGTLTQGWFELLDNGDALIEESDFSRVLRISRERVRWEYVNEVSAGIVGLIYGAQYFPPEMINLEWRETPGCN